MMYRICIARNGYYYVQRLGGNGSYGYRMIGNFFRTRRGAEKLIYDLKATEPRRPSLMNPRIVAYY